MKSYKCALLIALALVVASVWVTTPTQAQTCTPLPPGLVSWWRANDGADSVGPNDGVMQGGIALVPGMVGTAFAFEGSDGLVAATDIGLPRGNNPRTLELWVQPGSDARVPFIYGDFAASNAYYILVNGPNACIGEWGGGDVCGVTDVTDDAWHHLALTYDGTIARLYVDGKLEVEQQKFYDTSSSGSAYIGSTAAGSEEYYAGLIDEVAFYGRALSQAEIQAIYNAGSAGKCRDQYRETFDGDTLDADTWEVSNPLNGSTVIQENGELVISSDGTNGYFCANPNGWTPGQGVALRQRVSGDFDVQVDFREFSGVGAVYLNVYQDSSNELQIKRDRNPDGRDYLQTFVVVTGTPIDGAYSDNTATAGTFRIMRTGNTIHTFFDGTHVYSVDAFAGPALVAMVLGSPGSEWETPRVVFDNFVIQSGTLDPIETCPVPVAIDIKPGSDRNSINLGSAGVVPVAILSSPTFDAQDVNPDTLVLASARVNLIGKGGKYSCSAVDVNGDGLPDLLCHVVTAQFALQPGDSVGALDAVTFSGYRVHGEDSIRIVP